LRLQSPAPGASANGQPDAGAGPLAGNGIGLFVLYLRQSRLAPFNADGASNELQAWAMLHGNPLLKGWWTTDVSWYTTELPEYMVLELFRGLRPDVVHVGGAFTFTLVVLLGALLGKGQARGAAGVFRAVLAGGIMFAPAIAGGTEVFLQEPDHTGTVVPILVLLLIMDRAAERWWVPAVACVLLAWTQVGDQLTLVAATLPVGAVAVARMIRLAIRHRPRAEFRFDALLLGAVLAGRMLPPLVPARRRAGWAVTPLLAAYLAANLAALCYLASWAPMRPPYQTLADWLVSHHYTEGLAGYWQTNSATVSSGGKVTVAPISPQATAARHWDSWIGWYEASRRTANFAVAVTGPGTGVGGLSTTVVRDHFGPPAHEYPVAPDLVVMVYDYNLLTKLTGREFPGPGE
jgi:hypothetical protein